jgi:hypothetical protein
MTELSNVLSLGTNADGISIRPAAQSKEWVWARTNHAPTKFSLTRYAAGSNRWRVGRPARNITGCLDGPLASDKGEHHETPHHTHIRNNPGSSDCSGIHCDSSNSMQGDLYNFATEHQPIRSDGQHSEPRNHNPEQLVADLELCQRTDHCQFVEWSCNAERRQCNSERTGRPDMAEHSSWRQLHGLRL